MAKARRQRITAERERELVRMAQDGDERALEQLLATHDPFLRTLASRCMSFSGSDFEEIHGAAIRGFVEGTLKFDLARPNRLLTYAGWYCRKHIRQALREQGVFRKHQPVQWSAVDSLDTPIEIVQDETGHEHAAEFDEALDLAIKGMPPFAQLVFEVKFQSSQHLSDEALSQHFGVPARAVRKAVNQIADALKAHDLAPEDATPPAGLAPVPPPPLRTRTPRLPRAHLVIRSAGHASD